MSDPQDDPPDDDWSTESRPPDETAAPKKEGPPAGWEGVSWFDFKKREWWYRFDEDGWLRDAPPVRPLGHKDGLFTFVTGVGEQRSWTSAQLHGRGGFADLFGGDKRWAMRHFPGVDNKGAATGRPSVTALMERLIWVCQRTAYFDGSLELRGVGTWREDGAPAVHAGDRIFRGDEILRPGTVLDSTLYVIGGRRPAPAHAVLRYRKGQPPLFEWKPATAADGLWVLNALDHWHWDREESRQLFAGGLFLCMLGDAPVWKNHMFLQAPPEAGKTTILRLTANLLGGSAGPMLKTYSKAYIESRYANMALTVLLDESESDSEADRIKHLFELLRMLNDDGALGGRGSSSGKTREFNVHGPVIMAATVRERWRPQDRRRVMLLFLRPLLEGGKQSPKAEVVRLIKEAAERSAALRARAVDKWPLYLKNFAAAHKAVMELGGTSGDGDQLGGLIAGWWTLVYDEEPDEDRIADVKRFADFIRTLAEFESGDDEANDCFNWLLGAEMRSAWEHGTLRTIGQTIARGRSTEIDAPDARGKLLTKGLRLIPQPGTEDWENAWLAIANKGEALENIYAKKPEWLGEKWNQAMKGLAGSQTMHPFDRANPPIRVGGPQRRCLFVPPVWLPLLKDDKP